MMMMMIMMIMIFTQIILAKHKAINVGHPRRIEVTTAIMDTDLNKSFIFWSKDYFPFVQQVIALSIPIDAIILYKSVYRFDLLKKQYRD